MLSLRWQARRTRSGLVFKSLGVLLYGAAAWGGLRGRPWLFAMGWAAHVAWDVLLHLTGAAAEYKPHWYPWFCLSFDLVAAAAVLASSKARNPEGITT